MMRQPNTNEPIFEERMGAAYEAGRKARTDGLPLTGSPFTSGTPADTEWRTGWHDVHLTSGVQDAA